MTARSSDDITDLFADVGWLARSISPPGRIYRVAVKIWHALGMGNKGYSTCSL